MFYCLCSDLWRAAVREASISSLWKLCAGVALFTDRIRTIQKFLVYVSINQPRYYSTSETRTRRNLRVRLRRETKLKSIEKSAERKR